MHIDLSVELFDTWLKNPLILASGVLGTSHNLIKRVAETGIGAATIKSISIEPKAGHLNPTVADLGGGNFLNAMGYPNMGLKAAMEEFKDLSDIPCPVIGSIIGECPEEFGELAAEFDKLPFLAIEVPLSCPHTPKVGLMGGHTNPLVVEEIIAQVATHTSKPVLLKLPAVGGLNAVVDGELSMVQAAMLSGVWGFTATNTAGPATVIDIHARKPTLGFRQGGLSGPALKPLAMATVFQLYQTIPQDRPIIGTGGVCCGKDVIEYTMAGATAVGIGSILHKGLYVISELLEQTAQLLESLGEYSLWNLKGAAQE